jgi:murein DD-endopeptidase MepM/ murein hydrolase activator NlpD
MRKRLLEILGIIITIILIMQNVCVFAVSETEQLQNQKDKNDQLIEQYQKKQDELEAQKSATMKSVEDLIGKISESESEIDLLESKVNDLQAQIKSKERDIQQKEIEYTEQEKLLDKRLIAMSETGKTTYLDVFLTATSFTDMISKYSFASELVECDKQLIQDIKDQKAQIEKEKAELESDKKELDTSLAQSEQENTKLKGLKKEKETYATQLSQQEKEVQKEIEELQEANRKVANEIKQAEIRYQKQLEELRKNSEGNTTAGSGFFIRPLSGGTISCNGYYSNGQFHGAIDYAVSAGTTVKAAADGVVMYTANLTSSYGTYVVIRHANGLQSYYAHGTPGSIVVSQGQTVKQGDKIMLSGNSGHSTGAHLHFEVRKSPYSYSYSAKAYGQDSRVNPANYM